MIFSIYSFSASNSGFLDSLDYIWKYFKCILKIRQPVQCTWSWPPAPPTSPGWWTSWNSLWPQWLKIKSCVARLRQMLEDSKEEEIGKMTTKLWLCGWVLYSSVFCWRWYQGCLSCLHGYQKFTERRWQRRWCPLVWSTAYSMATTEYLSSFCCSPPVKQLLLAQLLLSLQLVVQLLLLEPGSED